MMKSSMNYSDLEQAIQATRPLLLPPRARVLPIILMVLGAAGFSMGYASGRPAETWTALLVSTVLLIGLGIVGILFSAIFQVTHAKWGRSYRRLAEGGLVLMLPALVFLLLFLAGAGPFLPWLHTDHLSGGKQLWLSRPFWDLRILSCVLLCYGLGLFFAYYSLRRDFCNASVAAYWKGVLSTWLSRGISDAESERHRCGRRLAILGPLLCICYAVCFTLLAFDLIMALEPQWTSTLFGAWYFMGHLFAGLALLILVAASKRKYYKLDPFLGATRQKDLATLLFAFCLVNIDFFWSQFLTIWYGNLPEETEYIITRTLSSELPWPHLAWVAISFFFFLPFGALLFRKVKESQVLLCSVSLLVLGGIFLARFLEIAPAMTPLPPGSGVSGFLPVLLSSALLFLGGLGAGLWLYNGLLTQVPLLPIGDEIFVHEFTGGEAHS